MLLSCVSYNLSKSNLDIAMKADEFINPLYDKKVDSKSWMIVLKLKDYLSMIDLAEEHKYQRAVLGAKYYKALIFDILQDSVIPPISVYYEKEIKEGCDFDEGSKFKVLDGLQRSYCLLVCERILQHINGTLAIGELRSEEKTLLANIAKIQDRVLTLENFYNKKIYIEVWENLNPKSILYKMIVLNTGQRKMDYDHQLDILNISIENELKSAGIPIITKKEKQEGNGNSEAFNLSNIVEGLVSYVNRTPVSGKKDAAESLFNKLEFDSDDDDAIGIIYDSNTYDNLIWTLKTINSKLIEKYKNDNPLKKYEPFLVSFLAALGYSYYYYAGTNNIEAFEASKQKLLDRIEKEDDPLNINAMNPIYNSFKSSIGDKRRKLIFESLKDFFVSGSATKIDWSSTNTRFFG
jgi:hypothetical protein